jgi:hypothetical protein
MFLSWGAKLLFMQNKSLQFAGNTVAVAPARSHNTGEGRGAY